MKKLFLMFIFLFVWISNAISYDIQITDNIPLPGITAISVSPEKGIIAAVNPETKTLFLIDTNSKNIINQVPLDITPSGVAIDPDRNQIIISSAEGKLKYIDIETGVIVKTISINALIYSIALIPSTNEAQTVGSFLYISTENSLLMLETNTGKVLKESPLKAPAVGIAPDYNLGYLTLITGSSLLFYDAGTLEPLSEMKLDKLPSAIAINPSTHIAVLTNTQDNSISIVSLEGDHNSPSPPLILSGGIILNSGYRGGAIDPSENIAYLSHKQGIAIVKLENPVPRITSLVPSSAHSGDSSFMLSVEGSKFIKDSRTQFDKKDTLTYFNTNEYLQAEIPHETLTMPGNVPVTVTNPYPGGGVSNTLTFKIYNPAPILESITPEFIPLTPNSSPLTIRARGRNFYNGSTINLNGENLKTKFISSILLEAEVPGTALNIIGEYPVVVINPAPGSFTSNPKTLTLVEEDDALLSSYITNQTIENGKQSLGSLTGRIVNTQLEPLAGVLIKIRNLTTETDADGYFLLEKIPAGKKVLLMDGSTEKKKNGHYPTIPINVDIQANTVNEMPFQVYLHQQKNYNFKNINPAEDTILTDTEVPGFELRIPKGVNITGWDGKANLKVSVRTVPTDKLPVKPLSDKAYVRTIYMFYFDKIGGGTPDEPIPVKMPNDLGLLPSEKAILWYYDESPNEGEAPNDWAIAGTGTVTSDGRYIVSDPGVGIPKFCCGAIGPGCAGSCPSGPGPNPCPK